MTRLALAMLLVVGAGGLSGCGLFLPDHSAAPTTQSGALATATAPA
jgi:hypothetical protein